MRSGGGGTDSDSDRPVMKAPTDLEYPVQAQWMIERHQHTHPSTPNRGRTYSEPYLSTPEMPPLLPLLAPHRIRTWSSESQSTNHNHPNNTQNNHSNTKSSENHHIRYSSNNLNNHNHPPLRECNTSSIGSCDGSLTTTSINPHQRPQPKVHNDVSYFPWCDKLYQKLNWTRISSFVVRRAPCFLCCASNMEVSATDRAILYRLNALCSIFAFCQVAVGIFLSTVLVMSSKHGVRKKNQMEMERLSATNDNVDIANYNNTQVMDAPLEIDSVNLMPNLWNLNVNLVILALLGLLLLAATTFARHRVCVEVDLTRSLRFLWVLIWVLPVEIFLTLTLFDAHGITAVWVEHWWRTPSFHWFRQCFCAAGTASTKCLAPIMGNSTAEEILCEAVYGATDCEEVRTTAQSRMKAVAYVFYVLNGVWGLLLVVLVHLSTRALEGIIGMHIVQNSRERNIAAWFLLPICGCMLVGGSLLFSPSSIIRENKDFFWIGVTYVVTGGTFVLSAFLAWYISGFSVLNGTDKRHKEVAVVLFMITITFTIFSVAAVFSASMVYSVDLVKFAFDNQKRADIACILDTSNSCTNCKDDENFDPTLPQCPQWTESDVLTVLRTVLKQSACLASMLLVYVFGALRFALTLRRHVSMYQIEYV